MRMSTTVTFASKSAGKSPYMINKYIPQRQQMASFSVF